MNQASEYPTLHQLTLPPKYWTAVLENIAQVWQPYDILLLLAEAAHGMNDHRLDHFGHIAVLQQDVDLVSTPVIPNSKISILSYDQWAELTLKYARTITWH